MDEFKATVASNLIRLRLAAGMTQAELGEQLNYSDKSISKWERGDAVPDAYVLLKISEIFAVSVDYLLQPHAEVEPVIYRKSTASYSTTTVTLISILGIWTLALLAFVLFWITEGEIIWLIFIYAIPISLITLLVLHSVWHEGRFNLYIVAALVLSLITTVYLSFLPNNFWQLFLVAVPAELVVYLSFRVRKNRADG